MICDNVILFIRVDTSCLASGLSRILGKSRAFQQDRLVLGAISQKAKFMQISIKNAMFTDPKKISPKMSVVTVQDDNGSMFKMASFTDDLSVLPVMVPCAFDALLTVKTQYDSKAKSDVANIICLGFTAQVLPPSAFQMAAWEASKLVPVAEEVLTGEAAGSADDGAAVGGRRRQS